MVLGAFDCTNNGSIMGTIIKVSPGATTTGAAFVAFYYNPSNASVTFTPKIATVSILKSLKSVM